MRYMSAYKNMNDVWVPAQQIVTKQESKVKWVQDAIQYSYMKHYR